MNSSKSLSFKYSNTSESDNESIESTLSISTSGTGLTTFAMDNLTLDTEIETQYEGMTTVREAVNKGIKQKI